MKKNKKLFLASIAAMGAVAIGTGAVSTFAWFNAASATASATATETSGITTANTAEAPAISLQLKAVFSAMNTPVELTDAGNNGLTRVLDDSGNVYTPNAAAQNALTKYGTGKLTFALDNIKKGGSAVVQRDLQMAFQGHDYLDFTVKISATNQVRIQCSALSTYTASSHDYSYVGAYTPSNLVTLGTIRLTYSGTGTSLASITYTKDNSNAANGANTDGLYFYYGVSPKNAETTGAGTPDSGADSTYGAISITLA